MQINKQKISCKRILRALSHGVIILNPMVKHKVSATVSMKRHCHWGRCLAGDWSQKSNVRAIRQKMAPQGELKAFLL